MKTLALVLMGIMLTAPAFAAPQQQQGQPSKAQIACGIGLQLAQTYKEEVIYDAAKIKAKYAADQLMPSGVYMCPIVVKGKVYQNGYVTLIFPVKDASKFKSPAEMFKSATAVVIDNEELQKIAEFYRSKAQEK